MSEIILQQTRVNQGLPYYLNFLKNYPNLNSLAGASENEVLRLWQGLGYYSRARNLLKCAKVIKNDLGGKFPDSYNSLLTLPGIGPYTAAAIASFSFDKSVATVDGNVVRVFSRLFAISEDVRSASTMNKIRTLANEMIPKSDPGTFNQAIMELGAMVCVPRNPTCSLCPLQNSCIAKKEEIVGVIPYKSKVKNPRDRFFNYLIFRNGDKVALARRNKSDIWYGLYEFFLDEADKLKEPHELNGPYFPKMEQNGAVAEVIQEYCLHKLSHQRIHARFFEIYIENGLRAFEINEGENWDMQFYSEQEILALPKPVLIDNFLKIYFNSI